MVMSCCKNCYIKYIDKDGNIDMSILKTREKGNFSIIKEPLIFSPPKRTFWMVLKNEHHNFYQPVHYRYMKVENGTLSEICSCDCHRKDLTVLH